MPMYVTSTDVGRLPGPGDLRAYAAAAPALGVPALYYADGMDGTGEPLDVGTWASVAAGGPVVAEPMAFRPRRIQ